MAGLKILEPGDIGQALRLSRTEGWNQTEKDWQLLTQNSENVCLAAETGGKIAGTATAINYENKVAWIGMVLVDREHRGQGLSKKLLSALFEQLKSCRSIKCLDDKAEWANYRICVGKRRNPFFSGGAGAGFNNRCC